MNKNNRARPKQWLVLALTAALAACGGGEDAAPTGPAVCTACSAGKLNGTAASGAPLANAAITVIDSAGLTAMATSDAQGNYSVNVATLTAPLLIRIAGSVGGTPVVYHSLATADDVGKKAVNITPLTELLSVAVLGSVPTTLVDAGTLNLADKVTASSIAAAETAIEARLKPMLDAAGVANIDLRTTEFTANGKGIDLVFDAISVSLVAGKYEIGSVVGGPAISVDPTAPATGAVLTAPSKLTAVEAANLQLAEIRTKLGELSALFATQLPTTAALQGFFADDFKHAGVGRDKFLTARLLREDADVGFTPIGFSFDQLRLLEVIDADNLKVAFRFVPKGGFEPSALSMVMRKVGGKWLLRGDQALASVQVSTMARLVETPMALAQVQALSGIKSGQLDLEGVSYTYYQRTVANGAATVDQWLGYPGNAYFGVLGWTGGEYDVNGDGARALRATTTDYYAAPSSRVRQYMMFQVDSQLVDARLKRIIVTGPGLPASGLPLTLPSQDFPRDNWVIEGDAFNWWSFNKERCAEMPAMQGCDFDWSKVGAGAQYQFSLRDASNVELGVMSATLPRAPLDEAKLYAQRATLFPQYVMTDANAFSIRNLFNDTDGPFLPGKAVVLNWTAPTGVGATMLGVGFGTHHRVGAKFDGAEVETMNYKPMHGIRPLPTSVSFTITAPALINWMWSTANAQDAFGNRYEHEISPYNPR